MIKRSSPDIKTYLPKLAAFKNSRRRWITGFIFKEFSKQNVRPKLFMPSQEAHQTSSFKTYLLNLTAFKKSSRRWITGFVFKDLSQNKCATQTMHALTRSPTNKSV